MIPLVRWTKCSANFKSRSLRASLPSSPRCRRGLDAAAAGARMLVRADGTVLRDDRRRLRRSGGAGRSAGRAQRRSPALCLVDLTNPIDGEDKICGGIMGSLRANARAPVLRLPRNREPNRTAVFPTAQRFYNPATQRNNGLIKQSILQGLGSKFRFCPSLARDPRRAVSSTPLHRYKGGRPMKAVTFHGPFNLKVEDVPDPKIQHPKTSSSRSPPPASAAPTCTPTTAA